LDVESPGSGIKYCRPNNSRLEVAVAQTIDAWGGDPHATIKAFIVANTLLEQELSDLRCKDFRRSSSSLSVTTSTTRVLRSAPA